MTASWVRRIRLLALSASAAAWTFGASALTPPAMRGAALREQETMRRGYEDQVAAHQVEVAVREQETARAMEASWEALAPVVAQSYPAWTPRNLAVGAAEPADAARRFASKTPGSRHRQAWTTLLIAAVLFTWIGIRARRRQSFQLPPRSKK